MMFDMSAAQFDLVYNSLSFTMASMMASTLFFWLRLGSVAEKYKTALTITGLVTFIASYHYIRIFNSWVDGYEFGPTADGVIGNPTLTGKPFNDAYRYMDWLLTVPMLLTEIVMCMKLSEAEISSNAWSLGTAAALMIILGYPGELLIDSGLGMRWVWWALAMLPFLYIVWKLLVGLKEAADAESDPKIKSMLNTACLATVVSWCTYPVVYILPMLGLAGAEAVVGIQIGYCISDIISKCGVGFLIYNITIAKSANEPLLNKMAA